MFRHEEISFAEDLPARRGSYAGLAFPGCDVARSNAAEPDCSGSEDPLYGHILSAWDGARALGPKSARGDV